MDRQKELDKLLRAQAADAHSGSFSTALDAALDAARTLVELEHVVAVVSDMTHGESLILAGKYASVLGISDYTKENSIWEKRILDMMSPEEQENKLIAELRFFHFLRHLPRSKRKDYCLMSRLRFDLDGGRTTDVLHRMYYIFDEDGDTVRCAICVYGPMVFDFKGRSYAVDTVGGVAEELTVTANDSVLRKRERQVLTLIDSGLTSGEIARRLNISIHTVNRHRQEILAKLHVKNSIEACRLAKSMGLI